MNEGPKTSLNYARLYASLHENQKHFAGAVRGLDRVVDLVRRHQPRRLLDYGSGKGFQYLAKRQHEAWGGLLPYCYDLGVSQLADRPLGTFDAVINCDMMEHIAEPDVDAVLADIFSFASIDHSAFVYFHISCVPSTHKEFADGRNIHLTQRSPEWWEARLLRFVRDGLEIEAHYETESRAMRKAKKC